MNVSDRIKRIALSRAYELLNQNPDQNLPKLLDWMEKMDSDDSLRIPLEAVRQALTQGNNSWQPLLRSLWTDIDDEVRETMFTNIVVNGSLVANRKLTENRERYQCNIPWVIGLESSVGPEMLSFDEMDGVIEQGKQLGTFTYLFCGDEPLLRGEDLIALCNKHSDCEFLAFTDGSRVDSPFTDELLRVKNMILSITLDGFRELMDIRRGEGSFEKAIAAMELLRGKQLPFGVTCTYDRENVDTVSGGGFFDALVEWGAKFVWFFPCLSARKAPACLPSPQQRVTLYRQLAEFRKTKPIFAIDLWNHAQVVGGCVGGGRRYLRINALGDVEPCHFLHYADSNIRRQSLLEAYRAPLCMGFHQNQPFGENMLRGCPLWNHPEQLRRMIEVSGAVPTVHQDAEPIAVLCEKMRGEACAWQLIADGLWQEEKRENTP